MYFDSRHLECLNACILKLVYILSTVRNGIEFQYPSIVFLSISRQFDHSLNILAENVSYCNMYSSKSFSFKQVTIGFRSRTSSQITYQTMVARDRLKQPTDQDIHI